MADAKREFARLVRRNRDLFDVVNKVKLWPTRKGVLHGVKYVRETPAGLELTTHCGLVIDVCDSKRGRAKRQIRHGYYDEICRQCRVPDWKIAKYKSRL